MIHQEMDIDHEWVFLPDNGFRDINQDGEKKVHGGKRSSDTKLVLLTDYFDMEQRPPSGNSMRVPKQVVPVSFPLEPRILKAPENALGKETTTWVPISVTSTPSMIPEKIKEPDIGSVEADKEVKTQVSFRKPTYNESVDMTQKMDSPKSTTRGVIPQIDSAGTFNFDDKSEVLENKSSPRRKDLVEKKVENEDVTWEENSGGLNLWKWSLTGIGAICSFGVAAATFCIIILGSQQRHRQQQQNQKLSFQRYADDKRMKQVVQHVTKLNEAISAVRGGPTTRARITYGGYYDGL
ncbi:hypothetical protein QUC31_009912 [Theobroma cacao]|uniref:Uncharacterized protein LOC18599866 isoform X1 n=1 Tax=Theobroma cacao TaxID=3641 RepID=A0AB32V5T0_THECC|nr:PREDICTED: uncharacterized protein LOC18599866 isoform X1 [Theobroma cacao]